MTIEVFPVTNNVWCVRRRSYFTCSYLILCATGIVAVDASMDSHGKDMEEGVVAAFGSTPADIRAVLLTHWHNDHAAGAAALRQRYSTRVSYHAGDRSAFTRQTAARGIRGWLSDVIPEVGLLVLFKGLLGEAAPNAVEADCLVYDGQRVEQDFAVIETPGHTPGHVSYYYHPEKVLFAGDALAVVNGQVRFMARPVTPDLRKARESMIRCLDRPIQHLCPGHRMPLSQGTEERCAEMVRRLRAGIPWPLLG